MSKADSYLDANFVFADFISMCYGMDSNSWENVMYVVEAVEKLETTVNISGNVCKIQLHKYPYFNVCEHGGSKIEVTRRALVKFIKWLNEYRQTCPSFLKEGLDSHV